MPCGMPFGNPQRLYDLPLAYQFACWCLWRAPKAMWGMTSCCWSPIDSSQIYHPYLDVQSAPFFRWWHPFILYPQCAASSYSQPLCRDLTQNKSKHIKSATAMWCYNLGKIVQMSLGSLIYLHEHAESSFKEISEAWWHMLDINRIRSIRITDLLHHLFQQWFVRSLRKKRTTHCE